MPNVKANGIRIEYDTIGNPSLPPLLLIMGLGGQLIHWDADFCRQLADKGLFIIRYDNRDTGLSTKFEYNLKTMKAIAGAGFPFDEQFIRNISARSYDRAFYPQGVGRQMMAVMAQKNRKPALASVTVPTLVIHGSADPLVPAEHGQDTADAIPGAQLLLIEGMGHDLPHIKGPWPQIIDAIAAHTKGA